MKSIPDSDSWSSFSIWDLESAWLWICFQKGNSTEGCGWHHFIGWEPGLNKNEKASWTAMSTSTLPPDCVVCLVASCSCSRIYPETVNQNKNFKVVKYIYLLIEWRMGGTTQCSWFKYGGERQLRAIGSCLNFCVGSGELNLSCQACMTNKCFLYWTIWLGLQSLLCAFVLSFQSLALL